jgi:hypothetical protein
MAAPREVLKPLFLLFLLFADPFWGRRFGFPPGRLFDLGGLPVGLLLLLSIVGFSPLLFI